MANLVSITLQDNEDARPIIESIEKDNPDAVVKRMPGVAKIDCPNRMVVKSSTVSEKIGRDWEPMEIHLTLVSIAGNLDEDDEELVLSWGA